ncbi:aftiphilin isoform X2 [Salmo salar]|uniref:Aftiphilin isoform X2 n=1 Tax=Salmo salar TaxID=8030 RepID=A0A1S3L7K1_SALSA|nr:aftiphilin-like isoform X2 [Salmo salar]|eukprot:XP_013986790.1 PREDICTED: aftiphilin-like isoform X2 [Salmo salar]
MEPDVIRMYSSSPPPMEDGAEEEDDEFGDFGGFSGVPTSASFTEFDTPATFNQTPALAATSPPELLNNGGVVGLSKLSSGPVGRGPVVKRSNSKSNGVVPGGCQYDSPSERTVNVEELKKLADHTRANNHSTSLDISGRSQTDNIDKPVDCNGGVPEVLTNGFATFEIEGSTSLQNSIRSKKKGTTTECTDDCPPSSPEDDFADFSAFSNADVQGHSSKVTNRTSENLDNPNRDERLAEDACQQRRQQVHSNVEQGISSGDIANDIAGSDSLSHPAEAQDTDEGLSNGDGGFQRDTANSEQRNVEPDFVHKHSATEVVISEDSAPEEVCSEDSTQEVVCSEDSTQEVVCSEDSTQEVVCSEDSTQEVVCSEDSTQEVVCSEDSTQEVVCSEDSTPEEVCSEDSTQEVVCSEDSTQEVVCSEDSTQEVVCSEDSTQEVVCSEDSTQEVVCSEDSTQEVVCGEDSASKALYVDKPVAQNGGVLEQLEEEVEEEKAGVSENRVLPNIDDEDGNGEQADEKPGSGNETETETSFGRPLSTDALEEYGDISTMGSVSSPPLQEETATPADHSQLLEDDDGEDFGDFGDVGSFRGQGFADFDQPELQLEEQPAPLTQELVDDDKDFGDFDAPNSHIGGGKAIENEDGGKFADFPGSDSFADFSSAPVGADPDADAGWNAFDEPEQGQEEGDSWAAFGEEPTTTAPLETGEDEWQESEPVAARPYSSHQIIRRDSQSAALCSRLEKLFQEMFPDAPAPQVGVEVVPLKTLLEPRVRLQQEEHELKSGVPDNGAVADVLWRQLLDIHEAFGLRHQWGGSHSNKTLLCSLGIDIRNILFTGQKKQPVIVPMYAASLGMLEPTKEPVKPISAAEMITSIAQQAPPVAPAEIISTSPPDTAQEVLPPVQFDWSSSGLTNPLDGVDPELYELTTAKLEPSGSGSRVADAFARLMSTMEKTSTSTRKPRKEENLSEEALKVIAGLPDLSFMQAKVLMFPTTLTPLGCSSDPTPD